MMGLVVKADGEAGHSVTKLGTWAAISYQPHKGEWWQACTDWQTCVCFLNSQDWN